MDPDKALSDMIEISNDLGQPWATRDENIATLRQVADSALALAEWLDSGGFEPDWDAATERR